MLEAGISAGAPSSALRQAGRADGRQRRWRQPSAACAVGRVCLGGVTAGLDDEEHALQRHALAIDCCTSASSSKLW